MTFMNKTPTEVQTREFNWAPTLGSDTIVSSTWLTSDPALTITSSTNTTTATYVWVGGGVVGGTYVVTNRIVTASGATLEDSFPVYVETYNFVQ